MNEEIVNLFKITFLMIYAMFALFFVVMAFSLVVYLICDVFPVWLGAACAGALFGVATKYALRFFKEIS